MARLQTLLTELGYYEGPLNGTFTSQMDESVRNLQESWGLKQDGKFGPRSLAALNDEGQGINLDSRNGYMDKDGVYNLPTEYMKPVFAPEPQEVASTGRYEALLSQFSNPLVGIPGVTDWVYAGSPDTTCSVKSSDATAVAATEPNKGSTRG